MFVVLEPFDERQKPELRDTAIMAKLRKEWAREGQGRPGHRVRRVADPGPRRRRRLQAHRRGPRRPRARRPCSSRPTTWSASCKKQPGLNSVATQFRSNTPQLFLDIDRTKVAVAGRVARRRQPDARHVPGLALRQQLQRLRPALAGHRPGRRPVPQPASRTSTCSRSATSTGQMVPLGTLVNVARDRRPDLRHALQPLHRRRRSTATSQPGVSTGDAIKAIDQLADETLPLSMKTEWTELMFMQIRAGNTAMYVFGLAVVCVFLALAALYESWSLPLAVILVVPLCLLCSVAGVLFTNRDVNIFVQIGLVVLVGLACKNAILIVEFAKQLHQEGQSVLRGDAGSVAAAAAADPDDLVRLHPRRGAAGGRLGGRGGDAPLAGHGRLQRHARRDAVRHLPDAGLLLRHPGRRRDAAVRRRRASSGSSPLSSAACWAARSAILLAQLGRRPAAAGGRSSARCVGVLVVLGVLGIASDGSMPATCWRTASDWPSPYG